MLKKICFHLMAASFFVAVFIELPLLIGFGMGYLAIYAFPDSGLDTYGFVIVSALMVFMLEILVMIDSSIRTMKRMSEKV